MHSLIIVAGAPWAVAPLRESKFLTLEVPHGSAEAIIAAADFAETDRSICFTSLGVFACGNAAAAAFEAAALRAWSIGAIVAVDGAFDAAVPFAPRVRAPSLLLVSRGAAPGTLPEAHRALSALAGYGELGLCESLQAALRPARAWFARHVGAAQREPFAPDIEADGPLLEEIPAW